MQKIERGEEYEHEQYGTVKVFDIRKRIDSVNGDNIEETILVEFSVDDGGLGGHEVVTERSLKTKTVDAFREACV